MRLSKFSKKLIAYLCAIAMVVSSFVFTPSNDAIADDYSGLTYTDITNNQNTEFDQKLKGSQYAINTGSTFTSFNVFQYQNSGYSELYIAGTWSAAGLQATVNGEAGSITIEGTGLRMFNAANYLTKRYNVIDVSTTDGTSGQIIVFCPEIPEDESTSVAPTEAPTDESTEAPTEAPTDESTEAPTDESTEAPADSIDTNGGWLARKADGSFEVGTGVAYNVDGISAIYAGHWEDQTADIRVSQTSTDPYSVPINVLKTTQGGEWLTQVCYKVPDLDDTKTYKITLKAGDTVLDEKIVKEVSSYQFCKGTGFVLPAGETTLTLSVEEQTMPPAPTPQDITITPDEAQIEANYNIWADWTNPEGTAYSRVYLEEADYNHAAATLNNGWIFNDSAVQPMAVVDNVAQTRDASVKVAPGGTYTLIVEAFDAWDRSTGTGSVEITIPDAPIGGDITFTRAERVDTELGGNTYYATFANWESVPGAAGYKSYYDVEDDDHKAKATDNGWVWSDVNPPVGSGDTWVNNSAQTKDNTFLDENTTYTLIVVAYDATGTEVARGSVELPGKESPSVEPSTEAPSESPTVEPSTEAPSVEPSTEAPSVEPSTEAPAEDWKAIPNGSGSTAGDGFYYDVNSKTDKLVVNEIQNKDGNPVLHVFNTYTAFSSVKVNGVEAGTIEGAGAQIPVTAFNQNINAFDAEDVEGNKYTVSIKNSNITPESSTEAPSVEPSTEQPSTEAPTPPASGNYLEGATYTTYVGTDWSGFDGTIAQVEDVITAKVNKVGGGWADAIWGGQISSPEVALPTGETFVYTATILSTKDKPIRIKVAGLSDSEIKFETIQLKAGEPYYYSVEFQAPNDVAKIVYALGAGEGENVNLAFDLAVSDNVLKVKETPTTTEAPTQEPTTQAPTQEPTSQAPTQTTSVETTVLPKPIPPIKYPDKAKVKKAVKKKKSAKKIKVKIKKVKGAKGYQVQVSKKKKGKALVKKFVTKTKFTIKSKKFKKKKKLWVKVRAYVLDGKTKVFGSWSKPKKTKKK